MNTISISITTTSLHFREGNSDNATDALRPNEKSARRVYTGKAREGNESHATVEPEGEGYIVLPGNSRGRRLINRASLDTFIESYVVGTKREADQQQRVLLDLLSTAADAITEARRIAAGIRDENESGIPSIIRIGIADGDW